MERKFYIIAVILIFVTVLTFAYSSFGQRPLDDQRRDGADWLELVDTNKNGIIEQEEFRAAADAFFKTHDKNGNGILEQSELPPPRREENRQLPQIPRELPPFLFLERGENNLTREQFDEKANSKFVAADANGDRVIDREEMQQFRPRDGRRDNDNNERRDGGRRDNERREPPPIQNLATAEFVGAEMRFGDKVVKNAPFSAETVREESKRLFDGNIVKNQSKGLIYRNGEGKIRQEQAFDRIGGFPVVGADNQPIRLVQILDFASENSYSLNDALKTYSKIPNLKSPPMPRDEPQNAKKESLGKQMIEGVSADGTRTTIEIPAGQIGNDKPLFVITEKWFSTELQTIVLSKHTDPFIGEVVFRLVNIKLGEPAPELFKVPGYYKILEKDNDRKKLPKIIGKLGRIKLDLPINF